LSNKLENKLYGREKELEILKNGYDKVKGKGAKAQVILVGGKSGVGKSHLVKHLEVMMEEERKTDEQLGYFVSGKFEQYGNSKSFPALADALASLCTKIMMEDKASSPLSPENNNNNNVKKSHLLALQERTLRALRKEWTLLADVIPNLATLLGKGEKEEDGTNHESVFSLDLPISRDSMSSASVTDFVDQASHQGNKVIRLKILFRILMRSLASPNHPIVLFLDDLQFSDDASLDLIESLVLDTALENILFVLGYRDDEIEKYARAKKFLENLTPNSSNDKTRNKSFTFLAIHNLSVDAIRDLLADVMDLRKRRDDDDEEDEVLPLANVILRKTQGNPFFALEFLQSAAENGFIYLSLEHGKWMWDAAKIEAEMNVSKNVVELVLNRLQTFPDEVQVLLSLASCIGAVFDATLLATLYENTLSSASAETAPPSMPSIKEVCRSAPPGALELATESSEKEIRSMLQHVVEQGILVSGDQLQYQFSHDRIQQASYLLMLEGKEQQGMELRVGLQLLRMFHSHVSQRWMLFVAVNSITRNADLLDPKEKIELVKLNLEAALKAKSESAFLLAADYLRNGLRLLSSDENKWDEFHKLAVEIYTLSAEMEYTGGNCVRAEELAREIIDRKDVTEDAKIPVYYTLMRAAGDQVKLRMALDIGIEALHQLGVTIPTKPGLPRLLYDLHKTQKLVKGMTDNDLMSLPKMTDAKKMLAMDFLMAITAYSWVLAESILLSVIFLKSMRMSLRYGASSNLPASFASYAILMSSIDDVDESFRFGDLAERLLAEDKEGTAGCMAFTLTIVHGNCSHWKKPLTHSTEPLLEGYQFGMMRSGDIEWACLCVATYCGCYLSSGLPLAPFTSDARRFAQVCVDYDQHISLIYVQMLLQTALNLMGESEDPGVLSGEAMKEDETLERLRMMNQHATIWILYYHQMEVNYIMGNFDYSLERGKALWDLRCALWKGHYNYGDACFYTAAAEFAVARKQGANKPPSNAMKLLKEIHAYEKKGAVNLHPRRLFLEAEAATLKSGRNADDVRRLFDAAIAAAVRSGLTNFAAMANERAAEFMMDHEDHYWAQLYMTAARDRYVQWGAKAKVKVLEKEFFPLLSGSETQQTSGTASSSKRGQERYSVLKSPDLSEIQRSEMFNLRSRKSSDFRTSEISNGTFSMS